MALESKNELSETTSQNARELVDGSKNTYRNIKNAPRNIKKAKKAFKAGKKAGKAGKKLLEALIKMIKQIVQVVISAITPILGQVVIVILIIAIAVIFVETIVSSIFGFNRNEVDYISDTYEDTIAEHCETSRNDNQSIIDNYYWELVKDINSNVKSYVISVLGNEQGSTINDAENLTTWGVDWNTSDTTRFDNYSFQYSGYKENSYITVQVSPSLSTYSASIEAYLEAKYTTIKQIEDITDDAVIERAKKEEEGKDIDCSESNAYVCKVAVVFTDEQFKRALSNDPKKISCIDEESKTGCTLLANNYSIDGNLVNFAEFSGLNGESVISEKQCNEFGGKIIEKGISNSAGTNAYASCRYSAEDDETVIEEFDVDDYKSIIKEASGFLKSDISDWENDGLTWGSFEIENENYKEGTCEIRKNVDVGGGDAKHQKDTNYSKYGNDWTIINYCGTSDTTWNNGESKTKTIEGVSGTINAYISLDMEKLESFLEEDKEKAIKALANALYDGDEKTASDVYDKMFLEEIEGIKELCKDNDVDLSMFGYANFTDYAAVVGAVEFDGDWSKFYIYDGKYNSAQQTTEIAKNIWGVIKGEGTSGTSRPQCTMYVKAMFMDAYKNVVDVNAYPGGNGNQVAKNIVNAYPDKFYDGKLSQDKVEIKAGSVISLSQGGPYYTSAGHVAFVSAVADDYVLISDGNYGDDHLARLGRKVSWSEWETSWLPYISSVAVPIG